MAFAAWFKAVVVLPLALLVFYWIVNNSLEPQFGFQVFALASSVLGVALAYDVFVKYWNEKGGSAPPAAEKHADSGGHGSHRGPGGHGGGHH